MKTFSDLVEEVQNPGLCQRCGGCVAFCTALNYGGLSLDEEGKPYFKYPEKCIECGLCYSICPETHELDDDVKKLVGWEPPMGRVLDTFVARAIDPVVHQRATDGGVVTALLLHLFDKGQIDGAIVTKESGLFQRKPWVASSREEIMASAGFHFDSSHGLALFSELYSTYSPSFVKVGYMGAKRMDRVAFVGSPCQVSALRRIQALGMEPSNAVSVVFGLFCTGNFMFGDKERRRLEEIGGFQWADVVKINVKEEFMVHLRSKEIRRIPTEQLAFMKRHACRFCSDYSAEYADFSFGGLGSPEGWTTVITRTPLGRAVMTDAIGSAVEDYSHKLDPMLAKDALAKTREWSDRKKQAGETNCLERKTTI
jgi:coenzyme F420 hydrogenase subunit beta